MERLTTRNSMGVAVFKESYDCENCNESIWRLSDYGNGSPTDKLAEYEDAEEQGKLFKLPCGFNDTIYHITICKNFNSVLDGTLWGDGGGYGTATGYYCPYELNDSCPFEDDFAECDGGCECFENTYAIFEDEVEEIVLNNYSEPLIIFKNSGSAYISQFGENVFTDKEKAKEKLKELQSK